MNIEDALAATTAELRVLRESVAGVAGRLMRLRIITKVHGEELVHRDTAMLLAEELRHLGGGDKPIGYLGAPGIRDPEHPCAEFSPGSPTDGGCDGDGHYLCFQCVFHHEERTP